MRARTVALALCVTTSAFADERHVVKAHDTCASLAQQYYGDARLVDPIHRANPELAAAPPPHVLREGTTVVIPSRPSKSSAPDAQLTRVRNHVDVITPDTKPGEPNDPLYRGNRVATQAASAADVTFRDESQVKLGEQTLVVILGDARSAAAPVQTSLMTGNLRAWLAKDATTKKVTTDAANVNVHSGQAQVSSDGAKTTRLAVYEGRSTIAARGVVREVTTGFGSKAELGKAPTPPRRLPVQAIWTTSPPNVLVDRGCGAPPILGNYDAPNQPVAEWHLQVARDERFDEIVVDVKAPATKRNLHGRLPTAGHFFIRVSAVDEDRFEGPFSESVHVLVVKPFVRHVGPHRELSLEPVDAPCWHDGTRIHGASTTLPNEPIRLQCAPAEGAPATSFTLE